MTVKQTSANAGSDMAKRRSQRTPPSAPIVAPNSTRLMMYATGDHVEDDERSGKARQSCDQSQNSASLKDVLAHRLEYGLLSMGVQYA